MGKKKSSQPPRVLGKLSREDLRAQIKRLHLNQDSPLASEVLQAIIESAALPGEDLAWLAAFDLDPEVASGAFLTLFFALESGDVPARTLESIRSQATPVLLKALQNPAVPDERKFSLGPMFAMCGGQIPDADYRSYFQDFEGMSKRAMAQSTASLSDDPRSASEFLTVLEALEEDGVPAGNRVMAMLEMVRPLVETRPDAAATLISAVLVALWPEGIEEACMDATLQFIADTRCPEAAWCLSEMGRWPGIAPLDAKAQRLANKLRLMGIAPAHALQVTFSHGLLSAPDGAGSRQLTLFFRTPQGGMDALFFLLNDAVGMKDANCLFEEGAELEEDLRVSDENILMAPCTWALALEVLADVWAFHEATQTPLPEMMFSYRPYLGEEPLVPQRRAPDLSVYRLDSADKTPDLFEHSEDLMDTYYEVFSFASERAYEYLAQSGNMRSSRLPKKEFERFLNEIAIEEKGTLLDRMAATLEVEAIAGRAVREENQIAARTWLGLKEDVQTFGAVPFIRALGEVSVARICENLRMGFKNQAEANQAAMDLEDELEDAWDEDEEEFR